MASIAVKTGIRLGLLTAAIILLFQLSGVFLVYHYFKFEYYLSTVATIFMIGGFLLAKWKKNIKLLQEPDLIKQLTIKELHIFESILSGKSNKEIAADNFVEVSTIKTHINNIYAKLTVTSRKELINKFGIQPIQQ